MENDQLNSRGKRAAVTRALNQLDPDILRESVRAGVYLAHTGHPAHRLSSAVGIAVSHYGCAAKRTLSFAGMAAIRRAVEEAHAHWWAPIDPAAVEEAVHVARATRTFASRAEIAADALRYYIGRRVIGSVHPIGLAVFLSADRELSAAIDRCIK